MHGLHICHVSDCGRLIFVERHIYGVHYPHLTQIYTDHTVHYCLLGPRKIILYSIVCLLPM